MNRPFTVTKILTLMLIALVFGATQTPVYAQEGPGENIKIVVPAKSVEAFLAGLLPYEIDLGKGFSGHFSVQSIDRIKAFPDKITFSSLIYGENVEFKTKIGRQEAVLSFGNINLRNRWEVTHRYDRENRILHVRPRLIDPETEKPSSQGEMLLTALFGGLSGIEHPIDLRRLPPVTTEFLDKNLTVHFDVTGIRTDNQQLTVYVKPVPKFGAPQKNE